MRWFKRDDDHNSSRLQDAQAPSHGQEVSSSPATPFWKALKVHTILEEEWSLRLSRILFTALSLLSPFRLQAYRRVLEHVDFHDVDQGRTKDAIDLLLSIVDSNNNAVLQLGVVLLISAVASICFALSPNIRYTLSIVALVFVDFLLAVNMRTHIRVLRGAPPGFICDMHGALVDLTRIAAAIEGFLNITLVLYLIILGYLISHTTSAPSSTSP